MAWRKRVICCAKVFRLVEEEARRAGLDPLAHQALIQIYGSETGALKVREVAERLDITPAFASTLVQALADRGFVLRSRDGDDQRVMWIKITGKGRSMLLPDRRAGAGRMWIISPEAISESRTEAAISILMFYAGVS